jgi:uncharacterized protein YndB with AHSA1/START domain
MSVTSVDKDLDGLTLTLTADFDAEPQRIWELWSDPRQLERWWGPPGYPATMHEHDLSPGGSVAYFMTGPDGDRYHGWWRVTAVEPPRSLEFVDGFADENGNPNEELPTTTNQVLFSERDGGTRMTLRATFESREEMEKILEMGAAEGLEQAIGQIDGLLAGD